MSTSRTPSATDRVTAESVSFDASCMYVRLIDGRIITVPIMAYRRLREATPEQRSKWELIGRGTGIHWEDIDEDLSLAGLLRDFGAATSPKD